MAKNFQHISAIFFCLILLSCKKDKDETAPVIDIQSPFTNASFEYLDNIQVKVNVTDDKKIDRITVQLLNDNFTAASAAETSYPDGATEYTMTENIVLEDLHMETGTYYVKCTATDGVNEKSEFVEVNYSGAPRVVDGIYVMTENAGAGSIEVSLLDSVTPFDPKITQMSDAGGLISNSRHDQIIVMGGETGDLKSFHDKAFTLEWSRTNQQNPPYPYFNYLNLDEVNNYSFISLSLGFISGYDQAGVARFSASSLSGYQPFAIHTTSDHVYSFQRDPGTTNRELVRYFRSSGAIDQTLSLAYDAKGFSTINSSELLLVGDDGTNSYLEHYTVSSNSTWSPNTLPAGTVKQVIEVSPGYILIAHSTGLYSYSYSTNTKLTLDSGNYSAVAYDEVNNVVWGSTGNQLIAMDLNGSQVTSYTTADPIRKIAINYNK